MPCCSWFLISILAFACLACIQSRSPVLAVVYMQQLKLVVCGSCLWQSFVAVVCDSRLCQVVVSCIKLLFPPFFYCSNTFLVSIYMCMCVSTSIFLYIYQLPSTGYASTEAILDRNIYQTTFYRFKVSIKFYIYVLVCIIFPPRVFLILSSTKQFVEKRINLNI